MFILNLVCSCSGYRCFQPCLHSPRSQPVSMLAGCGGWRGFGCQVSQQGPKTTPSAINHHHALLGLLLGGIGHFFCPQRAGWSRGSALGQSAGPAGGFQLGKSHRCARKRKHSGLIPGDIHGFYLLAICPSSSPFLMVFIPAKNGKCTPRSRASCQPAAHTPVSLPWHTPMALVGRRGIKHQNLEFSTQNVGAHPQGTATYPWHGAGASGASVPAVPAPSHPAHTRFAGAPAGTATLFPFPRVFAIEGQKLLLENQHTAFCKEQPI